MLQAQKENWKPDDLPIAVGTLTPLTDRVATAFFLIEQLGDGTHNPVAIPRNDNKSSWGFKIRLERKPLAFDAWRLLGEGGKAQRACRSENRKYPQRFALQG